MFERTKGLPTQILADESGLPVYTGFKTNIYFFDVNIKKPWTFFFLFFKGESEGWMKAVEFGQKFICFSVVIKDGKSVVNISEVC